MGIYGQNSHKKQTDINPLIQVSFSYYRANGRDFKISVNATPPPPIKKKSLAIQIKPLFIKGVRNAFIRIRIAGEINCVKPL